MYNKCACILSMSVSCLCLYPVYALMLAKTTILHDIYIFIHDIYIVSEANLLMDIIGSTLFFWMSLPVGVIGPILRS